MANTDEPVPAYIPLSEKNYEEFGQFCKTLQLEFVRNYDYRVGDCLFDAVSYAMLSKKKFSKNEQFQNSDNLRVHAVNMLKDYVVDGHPQQQKWIEAIKWDLIDLHDRPNASINEYCELMSKSSYDHNGLWGSGIMMQFLALYLQRPLQVYNIAMFRDMKEKNKDVRHMHYTISDGVALGNDPVRIAYNGIDHYIPIVELQANNSPTNSGSVSRKGSPPRQNPPKKSKTDNIQNHGDTTELYSYDELNNGFIFGRDYTFDVYINHISEPESLTNQRESNTNNVDKIYQLLETTSTKMSKLVLKPIGIQLKGSKDMKKFDQQFTFEDAKKLPNYTMNSKPTTSFISSLRWEPVDGQHVVKACKIAATKYEQGRMSKEDYETKFQKRQATIVYYNEPLKYLALSSHLNEEYFKRELYTTVSQNLKKMRSVYEYYECPNPDSRQDDGKRMNVVKAMIYILHRQSDKTKDKTLSTLWKKLDYYTSHIFLADEDAFKKLLKMCQLYDEKCIFFNEKDKNRFEKDKEFSNRPFMIKWLKPWRNLPMEQHKQLSLLCSQPQSCYFNGVDANTSHPNTAAFVANRMKSFLAAGNALKWLVNKDQQLLPQKMFLHDISKYGSEDQLISLVNNGFKDFKTNWANISSKQELSKLENLEKLIPREIYNLYDSTKEILLKPHTQWTWEHTKIIKNKKGLKMLIPIKIAVKLGTIQEDSIVIPEDALFIFDTRYGGGSKEKGDWTTEDYESFGANMTKWTVKNKRWNAILLLPLGHTNPTLNIKKPYIAFDGIYRWPHHKKIGILKKGTDEKIINIEAFSRITFIFSSPIPNFKLNFPNDRDTKLRMVSDNENTDISQRGKAAIVSLIQNYLPENWSIVLVGATNQVSNIISKLPMKVSKIYVIESSRNQIEELKQVIDPTSKQHSK